MMTGWTFSFVHNPWSRLLSLYKQEASDEATSGRLVDGVYKGFINHGIPIRPGMSFEEFCDVVCDIPDHRTDKHLQSQAYTLIKNGQPIVRFIGKLERINEDWKDKHHRRQRARNRSQTKRIGRGWRISSG
jgi:hypothetical protein